MAKQQVNTTTTTQVTKTRVKKYGSTNSSGYRQCNICHGTGVVKTKPKTKGKKK